MVVIGEMHVLEFDQSAKWRRLNFQRFNTRRVDNLRSGIDHRKYSIGGRNTAGYHGPELAEIADWLLCQEHRGQKCYEVIELKIAVAGLIACIKERSGDHEPGKQICGRNGSRAPAHDLEHGLKARR